ncbi:MAG TPA: AgmX/PglI C-terminal domain-containing protein [Haliangiales bacterium]|nr:AgmX/PglI C-terminal domain-containing protein [Haliangiales bacterium]
MPQQAQSPPRADAVPRPKILRIGVILGDKIVEERLIRDRGPVSIGQSARNTFSVPTPELPRSWPLFQLTGGRYVLHVSETMDGRISDGGQVLTLAQLKQTGRAQRVGQGPTKSGWLIAVTEASRGKIVIGEMTLLFQFVQAPPLQPRPQLPHSVKGSFTDRIDPYLSVVLSISLAVHIIVFCYFKFFVKDTNPPPPDVIPDQFARVVMTRPKPPTPPKEPEKPGMQNEGEKKEEKKAEKKGEDKPKVEEKEKPSAADIKAKVESSAVIRTLNQLAAKGKNGTAIATSDKEAWGDLDKGLKKVGQEGGVQIATTSSGTRTTGTGDVASGKEIGVTGPEGPGSTGREKVEEQIKTRTEAGRLEGEGEVGLDPNVVATTIGRLYKQKVNACYQRGLKTNPNLGGRVDIAFTVGVAGNVIKASVSGFDSSVDSCIEQEVRRWRFTKPQAPAEFEIPFILRKL